MTTALPPLRFLHPLLLSLFLLLSLIPPIQAQLCLHDGGMWGSLKHKVEPLTQPIQDSLTSKYNKLSDKGRFLTGACVGFGASRFAVRTTMKTVKTIGAAYIAFEALEYAGILKEARSNKETKQLLAQTRDYCLRTMDGIRHDIRSQLQPKKIRSSFNCSMKKDKAGTVGFGTGAFLGFAL
mmetsp:Transcript_10758/g.23854  ORF Transcript_10758/g.23854 Transcript_10758/m.23854 type:complete len:181 (+) Transcript_10758:59-601(+)|eukprot:CAMPEP_0172312040 /NCGR_PEP_ID=MMETSP1058-20130122/16469_1 /TAXON_ID=83371 /ORGANISM="Detonula confervacea, Strain CCMP 353" /LENGTH=180 /DNA_ID=CAMNT_0013025383 /DNA_START=20 /DNA_END=562 /DNA_ORIENTATION=-